MRLHTLPVTSVHYAITHHFSDVSTLCGYTRHTPYQWRQHIMRLHSTISVKHACHGWNIGQKPVHHQQHIVTWIISFWIFSPRWACIHSWRVIKSDVVYISREESVQKRRLTQRKCVRVVGDNEGSPAVHGTDRVQSELLPFGVDARDRRERQFPSVSQKVEGRRDRQLGHTSAQVSVGVRADDRPTERAARGCPDDDDPGIRVRLRWHERPDRCGQERGALLPGPATGQRRTSAIAHVPNDEDFRPERVRLSSTEHLRRPVSSVQRLGEAAGEGRQCSAGQSSWPARRCPGGGPGGRDGAVPRQAGQQQQQRQDALVVDILLRVQRPDERGGVPQMGQWGPRWRHRVCFRGSPHRWHRTVPSHISTIWQDAGRIRSQILD